MTDKEKIIKYLNYKGISKNEFYQTTGLSVGFLASGSSLGVDKLRIIIDNYHDFNYDWLITDKGDMLKSTADQVEKIQPEAQSDTEKGLMELIHNNATLVETNKKLTDRLLKMMEAKDSE